uniref:GH15083p n=1 Tax=Drosophila melanogaster TaxID=7227 RepID=Q95T68_DROME|nr:GH15083p [Drosophila melanogaster]
MNRQAKFLILCLFVGLFSANLCEEGESLIKLHRIKIELKTRRTLISQLCTRTHTHTRLHVHAYVCANPSRVCAVRACGCVCA